MKSIAILIPMHNEQEVLDHLYQRLDALAQQVPHYAFEFLFVDDGSSDESVSMVKKYAQEDSRVSFVILSRNFGKELAMIAGIDYVKSDALVIIDADLQDPPELIPEMIKHWEQGYDDVYARRTSRKGESFLKKKTSQMYYNTLQKATRIPIQKDTGDFRLLDSKCIKALQAIREENRNTKALISWIGFNKKEITYERDARVAGSTKWNYFKLVGLAIDGITSFTTAPLRMATVAGFIISLLTFCFAIFTAVKTLIFGADTAGYPSTLIAILFLGGIQLLSIGVLGEYISRIFTETKSRPLYLVNEAHVGNAQSA
jgi:glycosyltransferase involved in cell wall biosynthesis